jgi:hypothetical protein
MINTRDGQMLKAELVGHVLSIFLNYLLLLTIVVSVVGWWWESFASPACDGIRLAFEFDCSAWEFTTIHCDGDWHFEHECELERQRNCGRQLYSWIDQQRWTLYCTERPPDGFQCNHCSY